MAAGSVGANPISHVIDVFYPMGEALGAQLDDALTTLKGKVEGFSLATAADIPLPEHRLPETQEHGWQPVREFLSSAA